MSSRAILSVFIFRRSLLSQIASSDIPLSKGMPSRNPVNSNEFMWLQAIEESVQFSQQSQSEAFIAKKRFFLFYPVWGKEFLFPADRG